MLDKFSHDPGFTLLEIMVALAIILLGTLAIIKTQYALLQCLNSNTREWDDYEKSVAAPISSSTCEKATSTALPVLSCQIESTKFRYTRPYLE